MRAPGAVPGYGEGLTMKHHLYFSPGMFGFMRLASYDYFAHVDRALAARFQRAGAELETHVSEVLPTASVRRRAGKLAELIDRTAGETGSIHLLGHSTGGLDARLVVSPGVRLPAEVRAPGWLPRVRSVTTMNTPHYGTPLASFFATTRGQQALYLLSAFTVLGLSLGSRPLSLASMLLGLLRRGDGAIGGVPLLGRSVQSLAGLLSDVRSPDLRVYLKAIAEDQGSMMQLSPEAMDLVVAGFGDRPGVRYQCTVSMAPTPSPRKWLRTLGQPWRAASLSLFTALHEITSLHGRRYPCAAAAPDAEGSAGSLHQENEALLAKALGVAPDLEANDGCVPLRSQLWGTLVWAGFGDHLDVLGHYRDETPEERLEWRHHDWLTSGSEFDDASFEGLMDAVAAGMLKASAS